jgi:hypothetical protein
LDRSWALAACALRRDHPDFDPACVCDLPYLLDARAQAAVREGFCKIASGMAIG